MSKLKKKLTNPISVLGGAKTSLPLHSGEIECKKAKHLI
jgi:hypothetical protein